MMMLCCSGTSCLSDGMNAFQLPMVMNGEMVFVLCHVSWSSISAAFPSNSFLPLQVMHVDHHCHLLLVASSQPFLPCNSFS